MVTIGFAYALAFLVLRAGMISALSIFQNIVIAGGAAAILGSIVVMPKLLPNLVGVLKSKGVVRNAAPVAPKPVPVPTPAAPPVISPLVTRVVVRKKITTEDGNNV